MTLTLIQRLRSRFVLTKKEAIDFLFGSEEQCRRVIEEHNQKVEEDEKEKENEDDNGPEL